MTDPNVTDFALVLARVWLGIMIFAHGWRHVAAVRSGPGMANWFESLGLKPGWLHAWTVTLTEVAVGVVLVAGFLTPFAYGGLCALLVVAAVTNHRKNGFFLSSKRGAWSTSSALPCSPSCSAPSARGGGPSTTRSASRSRSRTAPRCVDHRGAGPRRRRRVPRRVLAPAEGRDLGDAAAYRGSSAATRGSTTSRHGATIPTSAASNTGASRAGCTARIGPGAGHADEVLEGARGSPTVDVETRGQRAAGEPDLTAGRLPAPIGDRAGARPSSASSRSSSGASRG